MPTRSVRPANAAATPRVFTGTSQPNPVSRIRQAAFKRLNKLGEQTQPVGRSPPALPAHSHVNTVYAFCPPKHYQNRRPCGIGFSRQKAAFATLCITGVFAGKPQTFHPTGESGRYDYPRRDCAPPASPGKQVLSQAEPTSIKRRLSFYSYWAYSRGSSSEG